jgi:S-adenosylmethionine:diacylglycerol 3-amino-3-carboxypropyl transferase
MAEGTQPGFRLFVHLSQAATRASFKAGALWVIREFDPHRHVSWEDVNKHAESCAANMLRDMSRDGLLAHKAALENELISVARLLAGPSDG